MDMQGRVAVVTGAGSGIGRASALAFARRGASVGLVDLDKSSLEQTAELGRAAGADVLPVRADVTETVDVSSAVNAIVKQFGRIDFAHNNAGVSGDYRRVEEYDETSFARILQVNLFGVWRFMVQEIMHMRAQGGKAAIVNTSSILGQVGMRENAAYTAAKHGVNGLTRAAAMECGASGIRVNAVAPGPIETRMLAPVSAEIIERMPLGRRGSPDEVANAVVWLCSDEASFLTGAIIPVDGGYLA